MSAMKLQKLCYYAQAWSLVWLERPLFREKIEAWANGPVCPKLYRVHRGEFEVTRAMIGDGDVDAVQGKDKKAVDGVLRFYGEKKAQWLSDLTHSEDPWRKARERAKLAPGERGKTEIKQADMAEFYGSL
jgi:uncharacterized phage-associated protein